MIFFMTELDRASASAVKALASEPDFRQNRFSLSRVDCEAKIESMKLIIVLFAALFATQAHAMDGLGKLALTYSSSSMTTNGQTSSGSRMVYDLNVDYRFAGSGWVLGATYQGESQSPSSLSRTSYGVTGGFVDRKESGFFILGTFFASSTYGTMTGGTGYQIDGGYKFTPGKIPIGLQLSYKHYDYSKFDQSYSYIDPYFFVMVEI